MTITDYRIVTASSATLLSEAVNTSVREGWQPLGGPVVSGGAWHQCVVKPKAQENTGPL